MAYQHQGFLRECRGHPPRLLAFDDEVRPFGGGRFEIDQEWMDDGTPDTIDYPTMRNMPETVHHDPVYSPARQGSALQALNVTTPTVGPCC